MLETTGSPRARDITGLPIDHPGARDPVYRARRDQVAALARSVSDGDRPPHLDYTPEEHASWRGITERLFGLHQSLAASAYLGCRQGLPIAAHGIPQLRALSEALERRQGFRIAAIPGLIDAGVFLSRMGERVLCCTQYIRHASRPEYTPEPDVVHEVVGHVPLLADSEFATLSVALGRAAGAANAAQLRLLDRLYWFTLEFGLIEERSGLRAYGAGLLSSFGELPHAFSAEVARRPFVMDEVLETTYDFSRMQDTLFVVPSFAFLRHEVEALLLSPRYLEARGA